MGRPTFRAYVENVQAKTGKAPDEFWQLATKGGFVRKGKVVAKHADMLRWLKSDIGLGHVYASFIIMYLRLRAGGEGVSPQMREWANRTGYRELVEALTTDVNKAVVRRFYDAMNALDAKAAADCWADEPINHGRKLDHKAIENLLGEIVQVHYRTEIKEIISEGDWVACRMVVHGRHKIKPSIPFDGGIYNVTEPDGREFNVQHIHMYRIVDGKIKEHWANRDDLGAARQLGMELSSK